MVQVQNSEAVLKDQGHHIIYASAYLHPEL